MSYERIGDYFYEDCRVFLSKFKAKESLRFDAFAEVWQEMKFSFVLSQWKYFGDMQQTIEEYLKICKRMWLKSETVEERVCGLYLLRAIYLKQPAAQYIKITLSNEDWQCMKYFLFVIKDFVQNETRYILQELFDLNAFAFSVPDCTPAEGKDDGGLSESVLAQYNKAHTLYNEMFLALQQENTEYNEQRSECLQVYPELNSFANAETDTLVEQLMAKLTVFENEVSKIRVCSFESNVPPTTSLSVYDSVTEETEGRKSKKRKRIRNQVRTVSDACDTEESSDSRESTNFDMPQLDSEDSDESVEEESRDAPTEDKVEIHMSDFDLSSATASSEDDERSPKFPTATSSGSGSATAGPSRTPPRTRPRPRSRPRPSPRPATARRGRWFRGRGYGRGCGWGRRRSSW